MKRYKIVAEGSPDTILGDIRVEDDFTSGSALAMWVVMNPGRGVFWSDCLDRWVYAGCRKVSAVEFN